MYSIIFILLVSIVFYILYIKYKNKLEPYKSTLIDKLEKDTRPYLWFYTERDYNCREWSSFYSRLSTNNFPNCLSLSIKSIYKYCDKDYNIVHLTPDNIYNFLPDLELEIGPNSKTNILQKYQIISVSLMEKYGGLWLPPWIIIFKPLTIILDKLITQSVVVFGSSTRYIGGIETSNDNISIFASRPNISLWKELKDKLMVDNKIFFNNSYDFYNTGKCLFRKIGRHYLNIIYQFNSNYDGSRDYNGKLITNNELFSINNILLENPEKCLFIVYNYQQIYKSIYYRWFLRLSIPQILESNIWISKLFRKSLLDSNKGNLNIYNTSTRNT